MDIAFLGLGQMGIGMAGALLNAGHTLTVWNRSAEKAEPLTTRGARLARTPREAADGAQAVLTMVADDAALTAILDGEDGLLAGMGPGALHLSHSTVAVATTDTLAARHADARHLFVSAPVFGRPPVAAQGKLAIVAAGAPEAMAAAAPIFEALGRVTFPMGDKPSAANLVKLAGNFMIMATVEAYGEAMSLGEKGGVAREKMLEVFAGTIFDGAIHKVYGPPIAERRHRPAGFAAPLGLKDMRLAGEAAAAVGAKLPLLDLVRAHLTETVATEGSDVDVTALAETIAKL